MMPAHGLPLTASLSPPPDSGTPISGSSTNSPRRTPRSRKAKGVTNNSEAEIIDGREENLAAADLNTGVVRRIVRENLHKYLIEWEGVNPSTNKPWKNTWEPKKNYDSNDDVVRAFERDKMAGMSGSQASTPGPTTNQQSSNLTKTVASEGDQNAAIQSPRAEPNFMDLGSSIRSEITADVVPSSGKSTASSLDKIYRISIPWTAIGFQRYTKQLLHAYELLGHLTSKIPLQDSYRLAGSIGGDKEDAFARAIESLWNCCSHARLGVRPDEWFTKDSTQLEHEAASRKFSFLYGLQESARDHQKHIVIFVKPGNLINAVESFLRDVNVTHTRLDVDNEYLSAMSKKGAGSESFSRSALTVTVVPTKAQLLNIPPADAIVGFDHTFDVRDPTVQAIRSTRGLSLQPPKIILYSENSIEHVYHHSPPARLKQTQRFGPILRVFHYWFTISHALDLNHKTMSTQLHHKFRNETRRKAKNFIDNLVINKKIPNDSQLLGGLQPTNFDYEEELLSAQVVAAGRDVPTVKFAPSDATTYMSLGDSSRKRSAHFGENTSKKPKVAQLSVVIQPKNTDMQSPSKVHDTGLVSSPMTPAGEASATTSVSTQPDIPQTPTPIEEPSIATRSPGSTSLSRQMTLEEDSGRINSVPRNSEQVEIRKNQQDTSDRVRSPDPGVTEDGQVNLVLTNDLVRRLKSAKTFIMSREDGTTSLKRHDGLYVPHQSGEASEVMDKGSLVSTIHALAGTFKYTNKQLAVERDRTAKAEKTASEFSSRYDQASKAFLNSQESEKLARAEVSLLQTAARVDYNKNLEVQQGLLQKLHTERAQKKSDEGAIANIQKTLSEAQRKQKEAEDSVSDLRSQLEGSRKENQALLIRSQSYFKQNTELLMAAAKNTAAKDDMEKHLQGMIANLERGAERDSKSIQNLESQFAEAVAKNDKLESQAKINGEEISTVKSDAKLARMGIEMLNSNAKDDAEKISALKSKVETCRTKIDGLESQAKADGDKIRALEKTEQQARQQLIQLTDQHNSNIPGDSHSSNYIKQPQLLKDEVSSTETSHEAHNLALREQVRLLEILLARASESRNKSDTFEHILTEKVKELSVKDVEWARKYETLEHDLEKQRDPNARSIGRESDLIKQHQLELAAQAAESLKMEKKLKSAQSDLEFTRLKFQEATSAAVSSASKVQELEVELTTAQTKAAADVTKLRGMFQDKSINLAHAEMTKMKRQHDAMEQKTRDLMEENRDLKRREALRGRTTLTRANSPLALINPLDRVRIARGVSLGAQGAGSIGSNSSVRGESSQPPSKDAGSRAATPPFVV